MASADTVPWQVMGEEEEEEARARAAAAQQTLVAMASAPPALASSSSAASWLPCFKEWAKNHRHHPQPEQQQPQHAAAAAPAASQPPPNKQRCPTTAAETVASVSGPGSTTTSAELFHQRPGEGHRGDDAAARAGTDDTTAYVIFWPASPDVSQEREGGRQEEPARGTFDRRRHQHAEEESRDLGEGPTGEELS